MKKVDKNKNLFSDNSIIENKKFKKIKKDKQIVEINKDIFRSKINNINIKKNNKLSKLDSSRVNLFLKSKKNLKIKKIVLLKTIFLISLGVILIPAASYSTYYFANKSYESFTSNVIEETNIEKLQKADTIVNENNYIDVSQNINLSKLIPNEVNENLLKTNIILKNVTGINLDFISFIIDKNSINNFLGTMNCYISYKNVQSNEKIIFSGFKKENKISIVKQPTNVTIDEGLNISLVVEASINSPIEGEILNYQWLKNNVELVDNNKISGSKSNILNLNNVSKGDEGSYKCKIFINNIFFIFSLDSIVNVIQSNDLILNTLVSNNSNINVTNSSLTSKLPSQVTLSLLTIQNVPLNTSSILNYDSTKVSFSNIFNANDNDGTLQVYLSYNGITSSTPITLSGFKQLPNITIVTINKQTSADAILQNFANQLKTNPNATPPDYSTCFEVKNFSTNALLTFNDVIDSVSTKITNATSNTTATFYLNLKKGYGTTSNTSFSFTAV